MRNLSVDDAQNFHELNLDKDVIKYTGDNPFKNKNEAQEFLKNYDQYSKFGVGRLAVINKENNEFIGWCGLKYTEQTDEFDIGFRFYKKYWNKGFATETAIKNLEFGFKTLGINKIVGRVMVDNIASIKVLKKIGLNLKSEFNFDGQKGLIYEIKMPIP
ncbi:MAG: GNAT family N-acetyltransferase [Crocinitomicaceae bacterium]